MKKSQEGQAALSLVFFIGGITTLIAVTIAFFAISFLSSGFGFQASQRAELVATAGAEEVLLKLDRDYTYSINLCDTRDPVYYSVPVGSDTALVCVSKDAPQAGLTTISSSATILNHTRKLQVIVSYNSQNSEIRVVSWQFVTL